ncbi:MAG: hypothetical protein R3D33_18275 [Hyphomicrobiaceae bacterium]
MKALPVIAGPLLFALWGSAFALPALAGEIVGPCTGREAEGSTPVCGSGAAALRVIAGTVSPDGRHAFAWRRAGGDPAATGDDALDYLVRLDDGAVLALIEGSYWSFDGMVANHAGEHAVWSPDGRAVIEVVDAKWETRSLNLFRIGAAGEVAGRGDLLALVDAEVRREMLREHPGIDPSRYVLSVTGDPDITLADDGTIRLAVVLEVPKSSDDPLLGFDLVLSAPPDGRPARLVSIQPSSTVE